ncbi:MAG: hypothetical protein ABIA66_04635 [Candidatus Omnitrophota bacterium]
MDIGIWDFERLKGVRDALRQEKKKEKDKDPQKKEDAPSSPPFEEEGLGLNHS